MVFPWKLSAPGKDELPEAMRLRLTFGLRVNEVFWISISGA
jgi:hypothetical protein